MHRQRLQGDEDGVKGVHHINAVDCVAQWESVATCERLSEALPAAGVKAVLEGFPFTITGFYADNGSEYINHQVAGRLEKLRIELTKSRPHSNDNGLAKTKNGAVVRKCFGYRHPRSVMQCKSTPSAPHTSIPTQLPPTLPVAEDTIDPTAR